MIENIPGPSVEKSYKPLSQKTLLSKYEMPIDHLSYEYIGSCKNVKELEKIVKILRSGEEGHYPHLQKTAEERLLSLSPNNILARKAEPLLYKDGMSGDEWNSVMSDVVSWTKEVSLKDSRLSEENNSFEEVILPPIRQPPTSSSSAEKKPIENRNDPKKSTKISDYASWDKYDVETELLKMEVDEERQRIKKNKENEEEKRRLDKMIHENERLNIIISNAEKLTQTEREILAEEEKNRGNEYYQVNQFNEAIKYYSASIAIWPTPKAFNNRAASYIKQMKFHPALEDANKALELDPNNVKGHYRRAVALQHQGKSVEAYEDVLFVLKNEPNNYEAKRLVNELRERIAETSRTNRFMTDEGSGRPNKVTEIPEVTYHHRPNIQLHANGFEDNELNLPERIEPSKFNQTLNTQRRVVSKKGTSSVKIVELDSDDDLPRPSTKLQIIEVEKSHDVVEKFNNTETKAQSFCKPKKCVVIDKRTKVPFVEEGGVFKDEST